MKTPEEIKKGLECCTCQDGDGCSDMCPYSGRCDIDPNALERDALAYIEQLERERDAAIKDIESLRVSTWSSDWCNFCKHHEPDGQCYRKCLTGGCGWGYGWEWRGSQDG